LIIEKGRFLRILYLVCVNLSPKPKKEQKMENTNNYYNYLYEKFEEDPFWDVRKDYYNDILEALQEDKEDTQQEAG